MLISTSRISDLVATGPRLIIAPILIIFSCSILFLPRQNGNILPTFSSQNLTKSSSIFDEPIQEFWRALAPALEAARPQMYAIEHEEGRPDMEFMQFEPLKEGKKPPERLNLTDEGEAQLFRSHYRMRLSAKRLGPQLPYKAGTTGIVTTASPEYIPVLLVSLRLMRQTGCTLPVDVFLADWSEYDATTCETVLPSLNARCIVMSEIYSIVEDIDPPAHYQYKILAILFSSYQNVLFLDSDDYPAHDPTDLFTKPPYTTHGLVTWPDLWANTASSHYYHIAGISQVPVHTRYSSESGQVMLDKSRHKESLLMMVYYNFYGPAYYYPLLSQNAHGAGDKETFIQAAMVMDLPFYQVKTGPGGMGCWKQEEGERRFKITGLQQVDPSMDFDYGKPIPNHLHKESDWKDEYLKNTHQDLQETAPKRPRPLFVHQSMYKTDPAKILEERNQAARSGDGKWQRMWGDEKDMVDRWGYDIERKLWEVLVEDGCKKDPVHETCTTLRKYFLDVFGSKPAVGS